MADEIEARPVERDEDAEEPSRPSSGSPAGGFRPLAIPVPRGEGRRSRRGNHRYGTFRIGSTVARALATWISGFLAYQLIALLVFLPLIAYTLWVVLERPDFMETTEHQLIETWGSMFLGFLASGAVIYGVFQKLRGRPASIGTCVSYGLSRLFPILGVSLLIFLNILVICLLSAIPLIFLSMLVAIVSPELAVYVIGAAIVVVAWYATAGMWVAVPVCVVERPGIRRSVSRSWALTKGSRWRIFLLILSLWLLNVLATVSVVGLAAGKISITAAAVAGLILAVLTTSLQAVLAAVGYHDLRVAVEGVDTEELASIFD